MNKEEIKKLKEKIKGFENKDVYVEFQNAIEYHTTIYKAKILASDEMLILSNGKKVSIQIDLTYLENIKNIGDTIIIELWNELTIILDC